MEVSMLPYIRLPDGRRFDFFKKYRDNMTNVILSFFFFPENDIIYIIISIISISRRVISMMINTIIVDAKQADREKIHTLLTLHKGFAVQGLGKDGYDAFRLITIFKPDIAILDINLDIVNGVDVLPLLKRQSPATLLVILASKLDDRQICKALGNKIAGFLLRGTDLDKLPVILKDLLSGKYYMNPQVATRIFHIFSGMAHKGRAGNVLSGRGYSVLVEMSRTELQIMSYVGEGRSNKEIGERMSLKAGTVRNYISSIMQKTGLRDRTQIAIHALRSGLVKDDDISVP